MISSVFDKLFRQKSVSRKINLYFKNKHKKFMIMFTLR
jgi:hypothetical protein